VLNGMSLAISDFIIPILVYARGSAHDMIVNQKDSLILMASTDTVCSVVNELVRKGISDILLFGLPRRRNESGTVAASGVGAVQLAVKNIKRAFGSSVNVITDVCVCQYNFSGHCGIFDNRGLVVDNNKSLDLLKDIAISHAESGGDCVAPSSMMDGQVFSIRQALNEDGYHKVKIMSYSAKHASSLYGPFRSLTFDKNASAKKVPLDKFSYQLSYSNRREAIREIYLDINEGADMVMIKPALWYLDLVHEVKQLIDLPLVVQVVSGEYLMLGKGIDESFKSSRINGFITSLLSIKRAGSDKIITYISMDLLGYLAKDQY
jgi:porphobilinogen synthase